MTRLEAIKPRVKPEHMDAYNEVVHIVEKIDNLIVKHDEVVNLSAIAGIKPNGEHEALFRETMKIARDVVIETLEQKVEDWEHKGDKNYIKHFNDGVE